MVALHLWWSWGGDRNQSKLPDLYASSESDESKSEACVIVREPYNEMRGATLAETSRVNVSLQTQVKASGNIAAPLLKNDGSFFFFFLEHQLSTPSHLDLLISKSRYKGVRACQA